MIEKLNKDAVKRIEQLELIIKAQNKLITLLMDILIGIK